MAIQHPPYFYDEELQRVTCPSYFDFLLTLNLIKTKGKEIDPTKTAYLRKYHLVFEDGGHSDYFNWYTLFSKLEEDFGVKIDTKTSFAGTSAYSQHTLYLTSPLKEVPVRVETANVDNMVGVIEASSDEVVGVDPPQLIITGNESSEFESLLDESNMKASKDALAALAKEKYNITIRKNLSFPNMVSFLEEKLAEKEV